MKPHFPYDPVWPWEDEFGLTREDIAGKLLSGDWFHVDGHGLSLSIEEGVNPFRMDFMLSGRAHDLRFSVIFNYGGDSSAIRLKSVFFKTAKGRKLGTGLLQRLAGLAIDLGADRILVQPGLEGSAFWPSRGAVVQHSDFFEDERTKIRAELLLSPNIERKNWTYADEKDFARVIADKDLAGLHRFIDRDDLKVAHRTVRRFLLTNLILGECVFDLDHPWTRYCLKKRVGFDVAVERARRGIPERPDAASSMTNLVVVAP